jgi:gliding motility-associated-like protein
LIDGENIQWYGSETLGTPLASGNAYQVTLSENLFVTQTIDGCESEPVMVPITVELPPSAPVIDQNHFIACQDAEFIIDLSPNQYNWYDSNSNLLEVSNSLEIRTEVAGITDYYITSVGTLCESPPTSITVEVVDYDFKDMFIPNVFTPNDDGLNDYFSLGSYEFENCLGPFQYVKVVNRNGALVYESDKRDFRWNGLDQNSGAYFYFINFQNAEYKGSITILK